MGQVVYYVQDQQQAQSPQTVRRENQVQPVPVVQQPLPLAQQQLQPIQAIQASLPPIQSSVPTPQPMQTSLPAPQTIQSTLPPPPPEPFSYFKLCTQQQFQDGTSYYLMRKQKDAQLSQSLIQQRSTFSHPHLVKTYGINNPLINAILNKKDDPQGIYFEYLNTNLKQLILERKVSQLFTQGDLVAMTKGLTSALAYLQKCNVFHGDISPETVYFDENAGLFKIADEELISGEFQCFYQTRLRNRIGFISPELIPPIRNTNILEVKENFFKADVFSLGLTLLEAATLKRSTDIYDIKEMTIFTQVLYERIYFISAYYSPEFTHAIRLMLEFDPSIRPDFIQLRKLLNQKIPKIRRKVVWPPVPVGLPAEQKNQKNIINQQQQQAQGLVILKMNTESEEFIQSTDQSPQEFSPKQHPRMLTAMPQKALERIDELNEKLNKLQVFQKPLEITQHTQGIAQSNNEKVLVAAFQPNGEAFSRAVQQQQQQQQEEKEEPKMKLNEQFQLKSLLQKVQDDQQRNQITPIKEEKQENQQLPNVNILQKTPDQPMQSYKFSNNKQQMADGKERQSNIITDFSTKNLQKMELAQSEQYFKYKEDEKQNRLGTSVNVQEEKANAGSAKQLQKQSNFREAVDKIKSELSETKRLIENYHKKTEQLKKDLHFSNEKY